MKVKNNHLASVCKATSILGCIQRGGQQDEGGDGPPLLHPHESPPAVLLPGLGSPAQEECGAVGVGPDFYAVEKKNKPSLLQETQKTQRDNLGGTLATKEIIFLSFIFSLIHFCFLFLCFLSNGISSKPRCAGIT